MVLEAMLPFFRENYGNAGTTHPEVGGVAERAVRKAREQVADLLNCQPNELIWTSGATESNNLAIFGVVGATEESKRHIVTQVTEHSAVLEPVRELESRGWRVTYLGVDETGRIDLSELESSLSDSTALVSIMWGNNEIGTVQDVLEIGNICKARGIPWHCDAAQSVGKVKVDLCEVEADFITLSAHKMYGPKGTGALFAREMTKREVISPLLYGGGQEKSYRSGTLNVPGIVGLGAACELANQNLPAWKEQVSTLRDQFERSLNDRVSKVTLNGNREHRLPHISNMAFEAVDNESLLTMIPEVVASTGSTCHVASFQPSHVLGALGRAVSDCSLRFGFGKDNTIDEVDEAVTLLVEFVKQLRTDSDLQLAD